MLTLSIGNGQRYNKRYDHYSYYFFLYAPEQEEMNKKEEITLFSHDNTPEGKRKVLLFMEKWSQEAHIILTNLREMLGGSRASLS